MHVFGEILRAAAIGIVAYWIVATARDAIDALQRIASEIKRHNDGAAAVKALAAVLAATTPAPAPRESLVLPSDDDVSRFTVV